INGEQKFQHHIWRTTPNRVPIQAEKGKSYNIEVRFSHIHTYNANLKINVAKELPINYQEVISKLNGIDKVIFVGGISSALEGEEMPVNIEGFKGGDRTNIELPTVQREFLKALKAAGKKVIFVNCSGSAIALLPETESCDAIVQAWYAGQEGGTAIADVLFGDYNPSGKLPVTFYKNTNQLPDYEDYSMKGRTYRYMTEKPLYPFGYGLSYTTFTYGEARLDGMKLTVPVTNTGSRDGEEIVQVYLSRPNDSEGPVQTLRAFKRVFIPKGQTVNVTLTLDEKSLEWFDTETNTMRPLKGAYTIYYGGTSDRQYQKSITFPGI
ncbi:MAG: glycoside hydrolase family 3 C-terminal domain-containing protein, partial [Prevotella sp.]|nr:glycoside hydrolase family 3 C-terminal domain-containing protein [Prevotella sp.]